MIDHEPTLTTYGRTTDYSADTPRDPLAAEDVANLREVVESQARLGHPMTIVPNDVLLRVLDATRPTGSSRTADLADPSGDEALRAALDEALRRLHLWDHEDCGSPLDQCPDPWFRRMAALATQSSAPRRSARGVLAGANLTVKEHAASSSAPDVEGPEFDADRMTHAWSILEAEVVAHDFPDGTRGVIANPDRWEPDRINAAAFVTALLRQYAALRGSRS